MKEDGGREGRQGETKGKTERGCGREEDTEKEEG